MTKFKAIVDGYFSMGCKAIIDGNKTLALHGASPLSICFVSDVIHVEDRYPECIVLTSGDSKFLISQIRSIKEVDGFYNTYDIYCGYLRDVSFAVRIEFRPLLAYSLQ